ncbi:Transcriptional regulator of ribosomal biogenesis protein [Mortierella polycephala]|uniref:Transcriptional regulator of ribosomal biogenesis protein n=1 Tax=Mortierella polycephala TaxID=41804 RepID=A0A9P6QEC0_9FUNG|nr:Transcriptional regulator of ribosomal biogenesis protein [Mortierella polycephala]
MQIPLRRYSFKTLENGVGRLQPQSPLLTTREFETAFCRDFTCCGLPLGDLHELLQHHEECHIHVEEDGDEKDENEDIRDEDVDNEVLASSVMDDVPILDERTCNSRNEDTYSIPSRISSASVLPFGSISTGAGISSSSSNDNSDSYGSVYSKQHSSFLYNSCPLTPPSRRRFPYHHSDSGTFQNPTRHALKAFSTSLVDLHCYNKRKSVVSLSDIYVADDNGFEYGENSKARSTTSSPLAVPKVANVTSVQRCLEPATKRQALDTKSQSISVGDTHQNTLKQTVGLGHDHLLQNSVRNSGTTLQGIYPDFSNDVNNLRTVASLQGGYSPISMTERTTSITSTASFSLASSPSSPPIAFQSTSALSALTAKTANMSPAVYATSLTELMLHRDEIFAMIEDMTRVSPNAIGANKPYHCTFLGCGKAYKNPNGLKYHNVHGHCSPTNGPSTTSPFSSSTTTSSTESGNVLDAIEGGAEGTARRPYVCTFLECEKRYKNLNGLKYHLEHTHPNMMAALRANQSSLLVNLPILVHASVGSPFMEQYQAAIMILTAALAAVEASPMMTLAANAVLTAQAVAAANAVHDSQRFQGEAATNIAIA